MLCENVLEVWRVEWLMVLGLMRSEGGQQVGTPKV